MNFFQKLQPHPLFDPTLVILFTLVPTILLYITVKYIAPHFGISSTQKNNTLYFDVCQRLVRACYALILVQGALRSLLFEDWTGDLLYQTNSMSKFYIAAMVFFYIYDTSASIYFKSKDWSMYLQHFAGGTLFILGLTSDYLHYYHLILILMEVLVPFGFLLFFVKSQTVPKTHTWYFLMACIGGLFALIVVRLPLQIYVISSVVPSFDRFFRELYLLHFLVVIFCICVGPILDTTWTKLYVHSLRTALKQRESPEHHFNTLEQNYAKQNITLVI